MMRVTQNMVANRASEDLQRAMQKLAKSQVKVASGRQWERPSDAPIQVRQAAAYKSQIRRIEPYRLSYTEATLNDVSNVYTHLKSLVVQAASDTISPQDRQNMAYEIQAIRKHLFQLANTKLEGQYIFAGSRVSSPPYVLEADSINDYRGDDQPLSIQVDDQTQIAVYVPGREIFGDAASGIFHTLEVLEQALQQDDRAGIEWALGELDVHQETILGAQARVGSRVNYLTNVENNLASAHQQIMAALSQVEDADLAEATIELNQNETQYEAATGAVARILQSSLLDFLA